MARKKDRSYHVFKEILTASSYTAQLGQVAGPLKDRQTCEKWIRDNGEAGAAYRVVVFVGEPIYVHVEPTEKRTLAPEPAAAEESEEAAE